MTENKHNTTSFICSEKHNETYSISIGSLIIGKHIHSIPFADLGKHLHAIISQYLFDDPKINFGRMIFHSDISSDDYSIKVFIEYLFRETMDGSNKDQERLANNITTILANLDYYQSKSTIFENKEISNYDALSSDSTILEIWPKNLSAYLPSVYSPIREKYMDLEFETDILGFVLNTKFMICNDDIELYKYIDFIISNNNSIELYVEILRRINFGSLEPKEGKFTIKKMIQRIQIDGMSFIFVYK